MNIRNFPCIYYILILVLITNPLTARPKTGLVLSGGGARGFAHIGTLKMIDSLGIPIDYIAGTSMGGIIGALYATGYSGLEIERLARETDWQEMFTDQPARSSIPYLQKKDDGIFQLELGLEGFTPVIPSGLIEGQKIALKFANLTSSTPHIMHFDSLAIPYRCIAVDLISGKEVVLKQGSLAKAMRATMAIPTVFSPVEWGDSLLVDGGILNNFPADVVHKMGAEVIIGVNAGTPLRNKEELQSIVSILDQTMIITDYKKQKQNEDLCKIVIRPDLGDYTTRDFGKSEVKNIINKGIRSARQSRNKLLRIKDQNLIEDRTINSAVNNQKDQIQSKRKSPVIFGISIRGNDRLPYLFIYRLLGIQPSQRLDLNLLNERINYLYGLGYFEKIWYEIQPVDEGAVRLILIIKEKPLRRLRIGFRYDDEYHLVGMLGLQATNIPIPGFRAEANVEFAGLFRWVYTLSYPSRSLNLPIIPYIRLRYKDIPFDVYDQLSGEKIAEYDDHAFSAGAGLGFLLGNKGMLELELHEQRVDINPDVAGLDPDVFPSWNDRLRKLKVQLQMDMLDDPVIPRSGILWDLVYDASLERLNSDLDYHQIKSQIDFYTTTESKHTFHLQGFATTYRDDLPIYKFPFRGGPHNFVGLKYNQLEGPKYGYLRIDYRYEHKKDIFAKIIVNGGLFECSEIFSSTDIRHFYGYGIGLKFLSIIGPFEIIFSQGSESLRNQNRMQTQIYVSHGLVF